MPITRYAEVLGSNSSAKDVVTENSVDISKDIKLQPRQSMIIEF